MKQYLDKTEEFTHVYLRPKITVRGDDGTKVRRALEIRPQDAQIQNNLRRAMDASSGRAAPLASTP